MSLKALKNTNDSLINTILFIKISQVIKVGKGLVSKMEKCCVMFIFLNQIWIFLFLPLKQYHSEYEYIFSKNSVLQQPTVC